MFATSDVKIIVRSLGEIVDQVSINQHRAISSSEFYPKLSEGLDSHDNFDYGKKKPKEFQGHVQIEWAPDQNYHRERHPIYDSWITKLYKYMVYTWEDDKHPKHDKHFVEMFNLLWVTSINKYKNAHSVNLDCLTIELNELLRMKGIFSLRKNIKGFRYRGQEFSQKNQNEKNKITEHQYLVIEILSEAPDQTLSAKKLYSKISQMNSGTPTNPQRISK